MNEHTKSTKKIWTKVVIGVLGAVLGGLLPASAYAAGTTGSGTTGSGTSTTSPGPTGTESHPRCTPADLPVAKVYVESLLKERVVTLETLTARVSAGRGVTASDKAVLQADLSKDLSAMQVLQQQIPSDETCAALVANAETMVFDYRVYLVMTPRADLVIVADTESAVASVGVRWEPGMQAAISYAANHGKDVAQAQQALDELKTQLTDALAQLQGLSATVLAQTPAGSPGNHTVFVVAKDKCQAAFGNLQDARQDLATILSVL
jgi:hypothetical protein